MEGKNVLPHVKQAVAAYGSAVVEMAVQQCTSRIFALRIWPKVIYCRKRDTLIYIFSQTVRSVQLQPLVGPKLPIPVRKPKITAITMNLIVVFEFIQGHQFRYQRKARMRLPIRPSE